MTLVDTNILLDIVSNDPRWSEWSLRQVARHAALGPVLINEIVYAEMSVRMERQSDVERALEELSVDFVHVPLDALFLAGKAFRLYRSTGGIRTGVLPDFFIGAHAQVLGCPVLTRDVGRFRTYFPSVELISPD